LRSSSTTGTYSRVSDLLWTVRPPFTPAGQLHALLSQDEVYGGLVTRFFENYGHPELAWMHHIACKRYGEAATALLVVEKVTGELSQKHVSSSALNC